MKKETETELKVKLEAEQIKMDEEFQKEYLALCEKYKRAHTFVYEAGIVGQVLKGQFGIVRK